MARASFQRSIAAKIGSVGAVDTYAGDKTSATAGIAGMAAIATAEDFTSTFLRFSYSLTQTLTRSMEQMNELSLPLSVESEFEFDECRTTGTTPMTGVRFPPELGRAILGWAGKQIDKPNKAEAIRRLVEIGLASKRKTKLSLVGCGQRAASIANALSGTKRVCSSLTELAASASGMA
jgi:glutamate-1-semialdehyde aminotransferase